MRTTDVPAWPAQPQRNPMPTIVGGPVADMLEDAWIGISPLHRVHKMGDKWWLYVNAHLTEAGGICVDASVGEDGRGSIVRWQFRRTRGRFSRKSLRGLGHRLVRWAGEVRRIRRCQLACEERINASGVENDAFEDHVESLGLPTVYDYMTPADVTTIVRLLPPRLEEGEDMCRDCGFAHERGDCEVVT